MLKTSNTLASATIFNCNLFSCMNCKLIYFQCSPVDVLQLLDTLIRLPLGLHDPSVQQSTVLRSTPLVQSRGICLLFSLGNFHSCPCLSVLGQSFCFLLLLSPFFMYKHKNMVLLLFITKNHLSTLLSMSSLMISFFNLNPIIAYLVTLLINLSTISTFLFLQKP